MDNIRAIAEALFCEQSFDCVINSIDTQRCMDKDVDESNLQNLFINNNRQYGTDVALALSRLVCGDWMMSSNKKSVFFLLDKITREMLKDGDSGPVCKYEHYLRWNALTATLGEDIFTTSFLAKSDIDYRNKRNSFAWKPFLPSDSLQVNSILDNGLSELHFHLKGSSQNFFINWLALMNTKLALENRSDWAKWSSTTNLYRLVLKASAIRIYLFYSMFHRQDVDIDDFRLKLLQLLKAVSEADIRMLMAPFFRKISLAKSDYGLKYAKEIPDYAIPTNITLNDMIHYYNVPFIGERRLMYNCFYAAQSDVTVFTKDTTIFYAYLIAKAQFRKAMIQYNGLKGFSNFQMFEERKTTFAESGIYKKLIPFMAVHTTIGNQPIQKLELRIAPKDKSREQRQAIHEMNKILDDEALRLGQPSVLSDSVQLGYTLHFIKTKEKHLYKRCRNCKLRSRIKKQSLSIGVLIRSNSSIILNGGYSAICEKEKPQFGSQRTECKIYNKKSVKIIAIDAANSEFNARPEVFATTYRKLDSIWTKKDEEYISTVNNLKLKRTFHVGEDYYDIVDGLRAIDESILFLNLHRGDRLGHAVALGVSAPDYYNVRHNTIILPKQVLLDNTIWLLKKMGKYALPDRGEVKDHLKTTWQRLFFDLYCDKDQLLIHSNYRNYYNSWLLRGDAPTLSEDVLKSKEARWPRTYEFNEFNEEIKHAHNDSLARSIFQKYHYDLDVKIKGEGVEQYIISNSEIDIIGEIQDAMMTEIQNMGISIETPPTSNLRITDVERYSQHPLVRFNSYGLISDQKGKHQLQTAICTDDQGVFSTSLSKEYTLMALALEKQGCYTQEEIYSWLNHVREMASVCSFL